MRPRDSQKNKLYKSEREAFQWEKYEKARHETIPEVEAYLRKVMSSRWFRARWPLKRKILLGDGRAAQIARGSHHGYDGVYLKLPRWARKEWVILHELAHGLQPYRSAAHGREFCSIYLNLVKRFMGQEAYLALRDAYVANRVRYKQKKYRLSWKPCSPEQLARLAEMRAKRAKEKALTVPSGGEAS